MVKNTSSQNGSAFAVITITLVVVIVGALGFVFWQNTINKQSVDTISDSNKTTPNQPVEKTEDPNKGYLVLEDWRVKFKLPADIDEIRYYKMADPNVNEYYELSTKRVEGLGERCVEPNMDGYTTRLSSIERSKTKIEGPHPSTSFVNNNEPIDGYYYYVGRPQSLCASGNEEMQMNDTNLLHELLRKPISY